MGPHPVSADFFAPLALLLPTATAQTIVLTGDALAAAAASDGDVLEIQSNTTFTGSLSWSGKALKVQAGAGFSPTIKGSPGGAVANLPNSNPPTKATFKGLTPERGADTTDPFTGQPVTPNAFAFGGTGATPQFIELTIEDCSVIGDVASSGTGMHRFTGIFQNTDFQHTLILGGTSDLVQSMMLSDCTVAGRIQALTTGNAKTTLEVRRTRIDTAVQLTAIATSTLDATVESSLIASNGTSTFGVLTSQNATAAFTNVTVTGFATGLVGHAGAQWHNMLLANNTTDLVSVTSTEIFDSLIEDGTFDGVNGSFDGTALMDASSHLLGCSGGLDAGNNTAPNVGATEPTGSILGSALAPTAPASTPSTTGRSTCPPPAPTSTPRSPRPPRPCSPPSPTTPPRLPPSSCPASSASSSSASPRP